MAPHSAPVDIQGLTKRFGSTLALDHLDLRVEQGTVHGFLGPNGAGKSTTLRILLGLYRADEGVVRVLGEDPARASASINRRLAYVPGDVTLWPSMTGGQALDTLAGLRGARDIPREKELIEQFRLDPSKKCRTYSKGNRQKVALIAAFSAPAELLLLDEPTSGLDPLMEQAFRENVRHCVAQGKTVLLSSHILSEVEQLCSHVTILRNGSLVETGALADMRHLAASRVTATFDGESTTAIPPSVVEVLARHGITRPTTDSPDTSRQPNTLDVAVPHDALAEVLGVIAATGTDNITCTPASLEDLFLRHYQVQSA